MPSKAKPSKPAAEKTDAAEPKEKAVKKKAASEDAAAAPKTKTSGSAAKAKAPAPVSPAARPVPAPAPAEPQEGEIDHGEFTKIQHQKLLELKDALMDSMTGMANETLRSPAEGGAASAFGMHQADAGTDAYDRDFALNLLSQEQDALYEIEEALKRIQAGTYGVCEMSGKRIPQMRLEVLPFARFTIECQQQYEREQGPGHSRRQVRSLFGLMGSEDDEDEDDREESVDNDKD